jgi:hypothetical protein
MVEGPVGVVETFGIYIIKGLNVSSRIDREETYAEGYAHVDR